MKMLYSINGADYILVHAQMSGEPGTRVCAKALWDHVTIDRMELGFQAGEVIEVKDMLDKQCWWGKLGSREGWFPSAFVEVR